MLLNIILPKPIEAKKPNSDSILFSFKISAASPVKINVVFVIPADKLNEKASLPNKEYLIPAGILIRIISGKGDAEISAISFFGLK